MKTVDYDALASSAPINKDAAVARDGRGESYSLKVDENQRRSRTPIPTRPIPKYIQEDLTGREFGRLKVMGLAVKTDGKNARDVWAVRCVCGTYETRRAGGLLKGATTACLECARLHAIRSRTRVKRHLGAPRYLTLEWVPEPHHFHVNQCPALADVPLDKENHTGKRVGKLTVVGLAADTPDTRWVVKCDCGAYEHRKSKVLKAAPNGDSAHQCGACAHAEKIKKFEGKVRVVEEK